MLKLTLDTNCIYDFEDSSWSDPRERLLELEHLGRVVLRVPAIAASERQRDGGRIEDFEQFRERLARAGLAGVEILRPMGYSDLCYYDWFVWTSPEIEAEELRIHEILFPTIAFDVDKHCPAQDEPGRLKWRNAKCDVQSMWCHIHYGGDIFITRDRNFHKPSKKRRLQALGAGIIARPEQAVDIIDQLEP
jgi:hypothetical protein